MVEYLVFRMRMIVSVVMMFHRSVPDVEGGGGKPFYAVHA
jgi:hypothetical protein